MIAELKQEENKKKMEAIENDNGQGSTSLIGED